MKSDYNHETHFPPVYSLILRCHAIAVEECNAARLLLLSASLTASRLRTADESLGGREKKGHCGSDWIGVQETLFDNDGDTYGMEE